MLMSTLDTEVPDIPCSLSMALTKTPAISQLNLIILIATCGTGSVARLWPGPAWDFPFPLL
jgi:hypothetical protein